MVGVKAHAKGIELLAFLDPEVPLKVKGDPVRFRQVLTNLLDNGIKFTSQGAVEVRIRVAEQDADGLLLKVEVKDAGVGMRPEVVERLFQSFFQGDSSTTRKYGGTGLGLAICRRLCELMGGSIGVESQLGAGSTVLVHAAHGSPGRTAEGDRGQAAGLPLRPHGRHLPGGEDAAGSLGRGCPVPPARGGIPGDPEGLPQGRPALRVPGQRGEPGLLPGPPPAGAARRPPQRPAGAPLWFRGQARRCPGRLQGIPHPPPPALPAAEPPGARDTDPPGGGAHRSRRSPPGSSCCPGSCCWWRTTP